MQEQNNGFCQWLFFLSYWLYIDMNISIYTLILCAWIFWSASTACSDIIFNTNQTQTARSILNDHFSNPVFQGWPLQQQQKKKVPASYSLRLPIYFSSTQLSSNSFIKTSLGSRHLICCSCPSYAYKWFRLSLVQQEPPESRGQGEMVKEMESITADAVPDALATQLAQQPWRRCERQPKQYITWVLVHLTARWTTLCEVLLYLRTAVGNLLLDCWAVPLPPASDTLCSWRWCLRRSPAAAWPRPCSLFLLLRARANPRICLSARLHLQAGRQQIQSQTLWCTHQEYLCDSFKSPGWLM